MLVYKAVKTKQKTNYSEGKNKNSVAMGEDPIEMKKIRGGIYKLAGIKDGQTAVGNINFIFNWSNKIRIINKIKWGET